MLPCAVMFSMSVDGCDVVGLLPGKYVCELVTDAWYSRVNGDLTSLVEGWATTTNAPTLDGVWFQVIANSKVFGGEKSVDVVSHLSVRRNAPWLSELDQAAAQGYQSLILPV